MATKELPINSDQDGVPQSFGTNSDPAAEQANLHVTAEPVC